MIIIVIILHCDILQETAVQPDFSAVIRLLPMEAVVSCKVQIIPNSLSESDDSKSTQSTGVIAVLTTLGRILGFVVRYNIRYDTLNKNELSTTVCSLFVQGKWTRGSF